MGNHAYNSHNHNGSNEPLLSLQTAPQIQTTPTTIPEIVFTDFSTRDDFEADLGLGQMDFQSFQMLSDTGAMIDPMDEDSFRRELQWDDLQGDGEDDYRTDEMTRLQAFVTLL